MLVSFSGRLVRYVDGDQVMFSNYTQSSLLYFSVKKDRTSIRDRVLYILLTIMYRSLNFQIT